MFDACKTGMIGLPYGEKNYDDNLSRFHTIPACHGQTDRRTDRIGISISRVSSRMLTRDKNDDAVCDPKNVKLSRPTYTDTIFVKFTFSPVSQLPYINKLS